MKLNRYQLYDLFKEAYKKLDKKFIDDYITSVYQDQSASRVFRQAVVAPRAI